MAVYSDVFCKVYNEFGWNYYPEIFGEQLLLWLQQHDVKPKNAMDLACGTGILCEILHKSGIQASGMDFSDTTRVWFQMTRPEEKQLDLYLQSLGLGACWLGLGKLNPKTTPQVAGMITPKGRFCAREQKTLSAKHLRRFCR